MAIRHALPKRSVLNPIRLQSTSLATVTVSRGEKKKKRVEFRFLRFAEDFITAFERNERCKVLSIKRKVASSEGRNTANRESVWLAGSRTHILPEVQCQIRQISAAESNALPFLTRISDFLWHTTRFISLALKSTSSVSFFCLSIQLLLCEYHLQTKARGYTKEPAEAKAYMTDSFPLNWKRT